MENTNQTIWRQGHSMILKRFSASRRSGQSEASLRLLGRAAVGLVLAVGFCLIICSQAAAASGYMYRRSITIAPANLGDDCGANLTDFPVLIDIRNANYLKKTGNDGHVANADGYDIAFTDADGNPLNHEVERYNPNSGTLVAWVKVPTLSASAETVINMVYGDVTVSAPTARPNDVWDANYQGVWHLNQSPTGNSGDDDILDSSANANHGQSRNMNPGNRADGRIGDALQFDGVRDYIRFGGDDLEITGNMTVEFWINPDNISGDWDFYIGKTDSDDWDDGWGFYSNDDNRMHFYVKHYNNNDITASLLPDRFQHFVGVYDGSKILLYKNGTPTSRNYSQGIPDSGTALTIGSSGLNDYNLDGRMDEVRISNTARDACWIETGYNNQSNPAGFLDIGEEEEIGAAVNPYNIMAVALSNGSITPAGEVSVDEGDTPIFIFKPDEGYEVDWVDINSVKIKDYSSDRYQFDPVTQNSAILVGFKKAKDETEEEEEDDTPLPDGCSQNIAEEYTAGFNRDDLDLLNVEVEDDTKHITLNTGNDAIDPNHIVIPWRQEVSVCFLYDGAGDKTCDFGWRLASDGPITEGTPNLIYENVLDEEKDADGNTVGNGMLDSGIGDTTARWYPADRNGDGFVNALDTCQVLGTFDAGTELVFYLTTDNVNKTYRDGIDNLYDPIEYDKQIYWYTKTDWNQDVYTSNFVDGKDDNDGDACATGPYDPNWSSEFVKQYNLGRDREHEGLCENPSGWMKPDARQRASTLFGLNFDDDDTASLDITWNDKYPAVIVGSPADQPNAWILGWENSVGGGDTDHNDLVFIVQRETGGTVQLNKSIPADGTTENITGVTIGVWDRMPRDQCATEITYFVSANNGVSWVEVGYWDEVYKFKLQDDGQKVLLNEVKPDHWDPGSPEYTYRTRRVDFTEEDGATGHKLIWRAELRSSREGCEPKIIDMSLSLTLDQNRHIARATPTVLGNVLFSGSMETPAWNYTSAELRGHLKNTLVYHPLDTDHTFKKSDGDAAFDCGDYPGWGEDCPVIWDAGDKLNQKVPSDRKIYIPKVDVYPISAEELVTEDGDPVIGDGVTTTFSGRLAHYPVLATTVRISDTRETFSDKRTDVLDGSLNGSGKINRFTGQYELTFDQAPIDGQPITAVYSYFTYATDGTLGEFKEDAVAKAELGLDDSEVIPIGLIYDFNDNGSVNGADANWLINWTRGWANYDDDGNDINPNDKTDKKEWILGAIDHSVPALATPPASSPWFYGTAFPEDKQDSDQDRAGYKAFKALWAERDTVVYVGARDGMLHAFDAGAFRWGDNPCTDEKENRGYFQWTDTAGTSDCSQKDDDSLVGTYCWDTCQPDPSKIYGSGEERWAFIPANLLPRLKNNYLQEPDKAFVDASPALADVYVYIDGVDDVDGDGAWRTVLLSAEGNGGDTIFCLDVTDPRLPPKFMWEFADPDLFRSRSSPAVAQIGRILYQNTTKWVAFFVSGKIFGDTVYPSIFVIDIADGSLVEKIELDAEAAGAGGILSGQPTIVDSDGNGYVDRLYIGSDKGRLYKINIPDDPDSTKYGIGHCVVNTDFIDSDGNSPPNAKQYEPIYGSPTVVSSTGVDSTGQMTCDIRIFFGTGDSPYYDEDINFADTRYAFFAYRDTDTKGSCDSSRVELDWYLELEKGHRIYASAFAAADTIYFGTSTGDTEDPCDINANSDDGIKANDGRLYAVDMYDPPDKIKDAEVDGFKGNVLAAPVVEDQHVYVQTIDGEVASFGSGKYNNETRQGGIPEIDIHWWRELF